MEYVIKNREPADVLRYFEEISAIPRGSGNEKAIGEYLLDFAAKLGLEARMDDLYNVVIKKPASPGCEHLDPVILQGHTDMVCEKNKNVEHDFTKDGIKLVVDGDILRADGTTLGADNGQAVACMMAFLARKDMKHPPLECVFTSQEEVGLIGAIGFDPYDLKGTRMINMDCGPEGVCVAGSAGGTTIDIYKTVKRVPFAGEAVSLKVRGLKGGHSGGDIDKERGNANKIAARVLYAIAKEMKVNLVSMDGGMMMNAIPRECDAVAAVADAAKAAEIAAEVEKKVYLVLNKPKGYVTSLEDPHADKTVMDLVKGACEERIYPVGRLDKNSLGLLLFTNDGDMTRQLTHPSYRKKKIYQVSLDKPLTRADMDRIAEASRSRTARSTPTRSPTSRRTRARSASRSTRGATASCGASSSRWVTRCANSTASTTPALRRRISNAAHGAS